MQGINKQLLLLAVTEIDLKIDCYAQVLAWALSMWMNENSHHLVALQTMFEQTHVLRFTIIVFVL